MMEETVRSNYSSKFSYLFSCKKNILYDRKNDFFFQNVPYQEHSRQRFEFWKKLILVVTKLKKELFWKYQFHEIFFHIFTEIGIIKVRRQWIVSFAKIIRYYNNQNRRNRETSHIGFYNIVKSETILKRFFTERKQFNDSISRF